ncbi:competence type IV pilus assembly protein ComGB [Fictibacillus phosphorivorans]|uniref:competence type IV pilus assembly protein ComGB n=1 Tax=Fictibacillus phosphorivorans TaxID=1221500 RepID=UPI00203A9BD6|nr:competence type IV pilus assembly protein ComGB [Fictibacillus phosphorivorans]MCM3716794.1 type II secretion system F family protein [Fictibacillus phosphorivorans]MCM3774657.1 type II secretion system F family protein [Fictibacillus phosphorivorans]
MFKKKWKRASQGIFLYKLGLLLSKGYSINKSIELVKSHLPDKEQDLIEDLLETLSNGNSVLDVFSRLNLPDEVISSLSINSVNGNLTNSLLENGNFMKKKTEWQERLNKAIRYPLFLLFLTVWIGILFYYFLFPQFSLLFSSLEVKTPAFTSIMLSFLSLFPYLLVTVLLLSLVGWVAVYYARRNTSCSYRMRVLTSIPFMRSFLLLMNSHYFSMNFGSMLKSGLSVTDALIIMEKHMKKGFFQEESMRLQKGLLDGKTLPELLLETPFYLQGMSDIIRFGQANGELGRELVQYGEWILIELEEKILSNLQKIQPILFSVIGGFVLLMFASMLLPMFQLMEAL